MLVAAPGGEGDVPEDGDEAPIDDERSEPSIHLAQSVTGEFHCFFFPLKY